MEKEVIVSIVSSIGGIIIAAVTGWFLHLSKMRELNLTKTAMENELKLQCDSLGFDGFLSEWNQIHLELAALIEKTEIDRFLLFRAWNGEMTPRWTTSLFQFRDGGQRPISYVHFELDDDYVDRLRAVVKENYTLLDTDELGDTAIGGVYRAEGVKQSLWAHIASTKQKDTNSAAICYCSFATHSDQPISTDTRFRCNLIVNRFKAIYEDQS